MKRAHVRIPAACVLASAIFVGCGGGGGGLSDPGLSNVQVEVANARSAVITPEGGTIKATGSNGFVYTLTIPAGALLQETKIAMYPIKAVKNFPHGAAANGGVNFAPDGLQFLVPATLTIQLPSTVDPNKVVPVSYAGDAQKLRLDLGTVRGQTITTNVYHFSGVTLAEVSFAALLILDPNDAGVTDFQHRMAQAYLHARDQNSSPRADFTLILQKWYALIVKPALIGGAHADNDGSGLEKGQQEYTVWLAAILYAQIQLGDPSFNVQPENSESETLAVAMLKRWYEVSNQICIRHKNNSLQAAGDNPLSDARFALLAGAYADFWHIPRAANGLDKETLLNNLCVKVVIERKEFVEGDKPGDPVAIHVKAGVKVADTPIRHEIRLNIRFTRNGVKLDELTTSAPGDALGGFTWPQGANPLTVGILASIGPLSSNPFSPSGQIAVFDQVSKSASNSGGGGGGGGITGTYSGTVTDQSQGGGGGSGPAKIVVSKSATGFVFETKVGSATSGTKYTGTLSGNHFHGLNSTGEEALDADVSGNSMTATEKDTGNGGDKFFYNLTKS